MTNDNPNTKKIKITGEELVSLCISGIPNNKEIEKCLTDFMIAIADVSNIDNLEVDKPITTAETDFPCVCFSFETHNEESGNKYPFAMYIYVDLKEKVLVWVFIDIVNNLKNTIKFEICNSDTYINVFVAYVVNALYAGSTFYK